MLRQPSAQVTSMLTPRFAAPVRDWNASLAAILLLCLSALTLSAVGCGRKADDTSGGSGERNARQERAITICSEHPSP
jgi:hypothetical protein